MKYILIILSITSILFYSGCISDSVCDETGIELQETITFQVVDKDSGENLFDDLNIYEKDSVKLLINNTDIISTEISTITCQFQINNRKLDLTTYNDSLYFLYFNVNEVDTIKMFSVEDEHFCLKIPQSKIINFIYNGDTLFNPTKGRRNRIEIKK